MPSFGGREGGEGMPPLTKEEEEAVGAALAADAANKGEKKNRCHFHGCQALIKEGSSYCQRHGGERATRKELQGERDRVLRQQWVAQYEADKQAKEAARQEQAVKQARWNNPTVVARMAKQKRARQGGAFGVPGSRERPAGYTARKDRISEKDREFREAARGPSGGGGGKKYHRRAA